MHLRELIHSQTQLDVGKYLVVEISG